MPLTLKYNLEMGHLTPLPLQWAAQVLASKLVLFQWWQSLQECHEKRFITLSDPSQFPNHCMNNLSHSMLVSLWAAFAKINQVSKLKEISFSLLKKSFLLKFYKAHKKITRWLGFGRKTGFIWTRLPKTFKWARAGRKSAADSINCTLPKRHTVRCRC